MTAPVNNSRLVELLIDRTTVGLAADEHIELRQLLKAANVPDDFSFDLVATLIAEPSVETDMNPLPQRIKSKILKDAEKVVGSPISDPSSEMPTSQTAKTSTVNNPAGRTSRRELLAWFAMAASLLLAGFLWFAPEKDRGFDLIAKADQSALDKFLSAADASNILKVKLAGGYHESGQKATGTVYWNKKLKKGFVKLSGVATNDPANEQYQLWVIDRDRDGEDRPNAGVFDISKSGVNIFQFRSDLKVYAAQGFAVTVERPGGINKSDLSKITLANLGPKADE